MDTHCDPPEIAHSPLVHCAVQIPMAAVVAPAGVGAAVLPAPDPAAAAAHDLWLNREYARQAARNRERGIHTHVQTIKFKPTTAALALATATARGKADPIGSPSTQLRIDRAQWDRPVEANDEWRAAGTDHSGSEASDNSTSDDDDAATMDDDAQRREPGLVARSHRRRADVAAAAETKEEEFEPVRSLDEEEAEAAGDAERQQQQQQQRRTRRRVHRTAGHHRFDDESHGQPNDESGDDAAAAAAVARLLDHCAGSLPAIVIDPASSLISGWPGIARPHLVVDVAPPIVRGGAASAVAASSAPPPIPAHVVARAQAAPVPSFWTTDYTKHSIRCILADGQVHTIAGGGAAAADPVAAASAAAAASLKQHHTAAAESSSATASAANAAPISGYSDGSGTASALFRKPRGLCIHPLSGEVFIADSANHCIRRVVAPAVLGRAIKAAVKLIEAESSFRRLRDPTADPVEEERAANAAAAAAAASSSSTATSLSSRPPLVSSLFPSPQLSSSLSLVCDLFLPLLLDMAGFEVTTIAGIPGQSGLRDTTLGASGRVEKQALFKFPIGMCLRILGDVEGEEQEADLESSRNNPEQRASSKGSRVPPQSGASLSSTSVLSASTSYELLVSDAGNGCIRRIKPNPFATDCVRAPSPSSPLRGSQASSLQQQQSSYDRGFIVDTIDAFVPVRCCHTSWNSAPQPTQSKAGGAEDASQQQQQQHEEEKESSSSAASLPPAESSSSFGSSLLSTLEDPSRLLSGAPQREKLLFQYPIGIALRFDQNQQGLRQTQAEYGTIWTVDPAPSNRSEGEAGSSSEGTASVAEDTGNSLSIRPRRYAAASELIVVDARASCIYSLSLPSGRVRRLAGSSDGGWGHRDGWASRARFCRPSGVAVEAKSGEIFVADAGNSCVRRVEGSGSSCRVTTLAGHPRRTGHTDGAAFVASLYAPLALALLPCPFYPGEHPDAIIVAGGFRQGLRRIGRCECRWRYEL